ncbi:hypothetical protein PGTUg99_014795 [Puccinia graminis f. sp. tritici]|uniref:Uncharacterized protein n=1 Tax=Puccinia graminis f. sp. tritici TaxID=56615 RepID=A0A5B0SCU3_PUCGR|nr:hypothetical protein PGTUg99_014795 [Puccinia graminis f. sp. tritici]
MKYRKGGIHPYRFQARLLKEPNLAPKVGSRRSEKAEFHDDLIMTGGVAGGLILLETSKEYFELRLRGQTSIVFPCHPQCRPSSVNSGPHILDKKSKVA